MGGGGEVLWNGGGRGEERREGRDRVIYLNAEEEDEEEEEEGRGLRGNPGVAHRAVPHLHKLPN